MLRPLTKRTALGERYKRPRRVQSQIRSAVTADLASLRRRLSITDRASPVYLSSECLVHLVRNQIRGNQEDRLNVVLTELLARCEANLKRTVSNSLSSAERVREEVLAEFSLLLASDAADGGLEELDFYECRFNRAFAALRCDIVARETRRSAKEVYLPFLEEDKYEPELLDEVAFARLSEVLRSPATQRNDLLRRKLVREIDKLPYPERKALVLCRVLGYKVESENPEEVTAATLCSCTGRTIRNRLARAAERLLQLKGEL